ncbi:hypothetical protein [Companilactobacillus nodensis]|uniref:Uncharacterized protein n=1 Tax=Companilactobacillus nodensis DSM 19682 = JCM 14932 = NBRC 107160 TaxID=1423775 RepID=A0A0R1K9H5_9LACO|nr:hypothetical protein [Companilactobacillus nodensis]KRK80229.1 hypothetical protein FD03_GL002619 [Companilactobacillus nodensis DSM 19682 = JCM 14932 = NBRC 107160]
MSQFGINDMLTIERMTIVEFGIRREAATRKLTDQLQNIYLQAYLNRIAAAVGEDNKYVFPEFKDFFDYEKTLQLMLHGEPHKKKESEMDKDLVAIAKRLQRLRGKEVKN